VSDEEKQADDSPSSAAGSDFSFVQEPTSPVQQPTSPVLGATNPAPLPNMAQQGQGGGTPLQTTVMQPGPTNPPLIPTKPIMGDVVQLTRDEYAAWTGGKPNSTWTGLDASSVTL
jgi:hypothetical protein